MRVASEIFQPQQFASGRNRATKQVEDLFLVFTYVSTQYNVIFTEFKKFCPKISVKTQKKVFISSSCLIFQFWSTN